MRRRNGGFTLVELLVVIAIIGTLVALLLPAVQAARETARGNSCRNNIKQLLTALTNMDTTQKRLPGYINDVFDPASVGGANNRPQRGRRASWIVMCFPFMEQQPLWDLWSQDFINPVDARVAPPIEGLTCPSDQPDTINDPWLNYIGNCGQAYSENARDSAANGIFVDNSKNLDLRDANTDDGRETDPEIRMSLGNIPDGTSKTLIISESVQTWYYALEGDNATPEFEPGFIASSTEAKDTSPIVDEKHIFGFVWKNQPVGFERVNGDRNYDQIPEADIPMSMTEFATREPGSGAGVQRLYESYGFPSSNHPGVVNVAFCGGQVDTLAESIDPRIYAMLMTSNRNRSTLVGADGTTPERKLPEPSSSDY